MNANQYLLNLTANMPMKQINIDTFEDVAGGEFGLPTEIIRLKTGSAPYLQRYYAGTTRDNKDIWLHRFLSSDSERHLHQHPFNCTSIMIAGCYHEEKICRHTKDHQVEITTPERPDFDKLSRAVGLLGHGIFDARPVSANFLQVSPQHKSIGVFDWHRITYADPETWTLLIVDPDRLPFWFFAEDGGQFKQEEASPRDWWNKFKPRGQNEGDAL